MENLSGTMLFQKEQSGKAPEQEDAWAGTLQSTRGSKVVGKAFQGMAQVRKNPKFSAKTSLAGIKRNKDQCLLIHTGN